MPNDVTVLIVEDGRPSPMTKEDVIEAFYDMLPAIPLEISNEELLECLKEAVIRDADRWEMIMRMN